MRGHIYVAHKPVRCCGMKYDSESFNWEFSLAFPLAVSVKTALFDKPRAGTLAPSAISRSSFTAQQLTWLSLKLKSFFTGHLKY